MLNGSAQLVIEGGEFCLTTPYKKTLDVGESSPCHRAVRDPSVPLQQADDAASHSSHPAEEGWLLAGVPAM